LLFLFVFVFLRTKSIHLINVVLVAW